MVKFGTDGNNNSIHYSILLIMVFVALFLPMCTGMCDYFRPSPKDREAEVKRNLHDIQLALERYATDHDGLYPVFVSGGSWADSYTVYNEWLIANKLYASQIESNSRGADWQPAPPGMGDALIMDAYMTSYPGNPFLKVNKKTSLTVAHNPHSEYGQPYERTVGGLAGNGIYEVFGPVMLQKGQGLAGDYYVHHIYNDPPYDVWGDIYKTPVNGWRKPSGNEVLQGNFSYYPHTEQGQTWPLIGLSLTEESEQVMAIGYALAGYGALKTKGQDVYNRNGEYALHCRTETRASFFGGASLFPDAIPFLSEGKNPSNDANNGGPDGIPDGVVIVLDSGVDKKSVRVDIGNTEGI